MFKNIIYSTFLASVVVGCVNAQTKNDNLLIKCTEPRPEICTNEYKPVCATRDTGVRCVTTPCQTMEKKTYGNACAACRDQKVLGYQLGACQSAPK